MSNRRPRNRAERRRAARSGAHHLPHRHHHDTDEVPVLPGIIPDLTQPSMDRAMLQAHEDLPPIPGTCVRILVYPLDAGYRLLLENGWTDDQVNQLRHHAATVGGDDPHMIVATRDRP